MAEVAPANGSTSCYVSSSMRKLNEGVFTWDLLLPDSRDLLCSPLEYCLESPEFQLGSKKFTLIRSAKRDPEHGTTYSVTMKNCGKSIDFGVVQVENFKSPSKVAFSLPSGQEKTVYVFYHELQTFEMTLSIYELASTA